MKKFLLPVEKQSWKKRFAMSFVLAIVLSTLFVSENVATVALVVVAVTCLCFVATLRGKLEKAFDEWVDAPARQAWFAGLLPLTFVCIPVGITFLTGFPVCGLLASAMWAWMCKCFHRDAEKMPGRFVREVGDFLLGYPDSQAKHVWTPGVSLKVRRWYYRVQLAMLLLVSLSQFMLSTTVYEYMLIVAFAPINAFVALSMSAFFFQMTSNRIAPAPNDPERQTLEPTFDQILAHVEEHYS